MQIRLKNFLQKNSLLVLIFGVFFLTTLTGIKGTQEPTLSADDILSIQMNSPRGFIGTPLEFSRARTQFVQLISLYERNSFILTEEEAYSTRPDAGYYRGIFRSLAPPGLSVVMYPFFLFGSLFGLEQLISFIPLIGIYGLSMFFFFLFLKRILISKELAALGTLIYGFATPGIIYASSPIYHSFSLFGITILAYWTTRLSEDPPAAIRYFVYSNILIGMSVFIDYAHPLIFLPFYLSQVILLWRSNRKCPFALKRLLLKTFLIPLMSISGLLFLQHTFFGNMFQMTNTQLQYIGKNLVDLPEETLELETGNKNRLTHFVETSYISRNVKNMFFTSKDGFFNASPLLFIGALTLPIFYFKKKYFSRSIPPLLLSGIVTLLIYTSFAGGMGDYSVGLRYLIPLIPLLITALIISVSHIHLKAYMIILSVPLLFWNFLSHLSAFYTTIYSNRSNSAHALGVLQWDYLIEEVTSSYWFTYIYSGLPLVYYPIIISTLLTIFSIFLLTRIKNSQSNHE